MNSIQMLIKKNHVEKSSCSVLKWPPDDGKSLNLSKIDDIHEY